MRVTLLAATAVTIALFSAGCAGKKVAVTKPQPSSPTQTSKAVQVEQESSETTAVLENAIAAIVNDEIITVNEIRQEAAFIIKDAASKGFVDLVTRQKIYRDALDILIEKKLSAQKIRELNINVSEEEVRMAMDDVRRQNNITTQEAMVAALAAQGLTMDQYRTQIREQIERVRLVSMEVRTKILVSESEARGYYSANLSRFSEEETYRGRHIFFKTDSLKTPVELKRIQSTALAVLATAMDGRDFAELAKEFSDDPAAKKDGGDLGTFKKGEMQPELAQIIANMKPGEISSLISTNIGFHIVKLESRIAGNPKPFDKVRAEIEEILYQKKAEDRFRLWANELRSKAIIEFRPLDAL